MRACRFIGQFISELIDSVFDLCTDIIYNCVSSCYTGGFVCGTNLFACELFTQLFWFTISKIYRFFVNFFGK